MRILSIIIFGLSLLAMPAFAAAPFGLEIGTMTETEFKQTLDAQRNGTSTWTNGTIYNIKPAELDIEGLVTATAIFDEEGILVGLLLDFHKNRFDALNGYASEAFQVQSSVTPFVGDKKVTYVDGNTSIWIEAPHMQFEMSMSFLDKSLINAFEAGSKALEEEAVSKEKSALFGK